MNKSKKIIIAIMAILCLLAVILLLVSCDSNNDYIVQYMVDGKVYVTQKNKLEEPKEPEKDGYEFVGWYYNDKLFDFKTNIEENIVLEAKFKELEIPSDEEQKEVMPPDEADPPSKEQEDEQSENQNESSSKEESNKNEDNNTQNSNSNTKISYTYKVVLIDNDKYSVNRLVKVYKNGKEIKAKNIYGKYNNKEEYKLGTYSESLKGIKLVSYKQFEKATNYKVELEDGTKVSVNEK